MWVKCVCTNVGTRKVAIQITLNMLRLVSLPIVPSKWLPCIDWSPPPKRASILAIAAASRSA